MATCGSDISSDEIIDIKCGVCAGKNKTKQAEKYCVECQEYYCIPCTDMHKMFPLMRGHTLLDRDRVNFSTSSAVPTSPSFPLEVCSIHKGRLLEMYCKNHDEIVCTTCVALKHRTCKNIHSIPEDVGSLYKQADFDQRHRQINTAKKSMENMKKSKENLIRELGKHRQTAIDSVKQFKLEMEVVLKQLEEKSIKEIEAEYERIKSAIQMKINEIEKVATDIENTASKLRTSGENKAQEFVCVKLANKVIDKAKEVEILYNVAEEVKLIYLIDSKLPYFLRQLKTYGNVSKAKSTAYALKQIKEINVRLRKDKEPCRLLGSCFTRNGLLLVADKNNNKLKRVDISLGSIRDYLDLEAKPIALCQVSSHEVAVTTDKNLVQFVSLGNSMAINRELKMKHYCHGIAYKDDQLFISDSRSTVYKYDMAGAVLNKIRRNNLGKAIFTNNRMISLNTKEDGVYVVDTNEGVIHIDEQGNYVSTITGPDLCQPTGVCGDRRGNILVGCWGSSSIVQINEESKSVGIIGKVLNPLALCFDSQRNKLAVAQENSNDVTVFEVY